MYYDLRLIVPAILLWVDIAFLITSPNFFGIIIITNVAIVLIILCFITVAKKECIRNLIKFFAIVCIIIIIGITQFFFQKSLLYPPNPPFGTYQTYDVIIKSNPSISQGFSENSKRCSYDVLTQDHKRLSIISDDITLCDLATGAKYNQMYQISGKLVADDYTVSNYGKVKVDKYLMLKDANIFDQASNFVHTNFAKALISSASESNTILRSQKTDVALMLGLCFGDKQLMSSEQKDEAKISGLTHLVAVSGTHFVIFLSICSALILLLVKTPKRAVIWQIILIGMLIILVHPTDSVKRATVMSVVGLLSPYLKRSSQSLNALAFAIIIFLIYDPFCALSLSLMLSCGSTAGIIVLSNPLQKWFGRFLPSSSANIISIPLAATLATLPILMFVNGYFAPYSVLANILVTFAVFPAIALSLLSVVISLLAQYLPLLNILKLIVIKITSLFASYILHISHFVAKLPNSKIVFANSQLGVMLIYLLFALIICFPKIYGCIYQKIYKVKPKEVSSLSYNLQKLFSKYRIILPLLLIILVFPPLLEGCAKEELGWFSNLPQNWLIAGCNVGQGDSTLIHSGNTSAILIDVGPQEHKQNEESVMQCFKKLNVQTVDLLILSHYHADHVGDLSNFVNSYQIKKAVINPYHSPTAQYKYVKETLDHNNIPTVESQAGQKYEFKQDDYQVKIKVISQYMPPKSKNSSKQSGENSDENDSSSALDITVNGVHYFSAGDLEIKGDLIALSALKKQKLKNYDIVKVNHHGSKKQLLKLEQYLNPKIALYLVGKNSYGHPNKSTLETYSKLNAITLRTDQNYLCGVFKNEQNELTVFQENSP